MTEVKGNVNLLKLMSEDELKTEAEKQADHPKRVELIDAELAKRGKK